MDDAEFPVATLLICDVWRAMGIWAFSLRSSEQLTSYSCYIRAIPPFVVTVGNTNLQSLPGLIYKAVANT